MMVPVRCMTCGKPVAQLYHKFRKMVEEGKDPREALDELGLERYCCRVTILTSVDRVKEIVQFNP